MPNHEPNSPGAVLRRLRRWRRLRRDSSNGGQRPDLVDDPGPGPEATPLTTLDATIRPVGDGRYRRLGWAPGEAHLLCCDDGPEPVEDRATGRVSLLYVGHLTDLHLCDAQSPARLEGGETFGWFNPGADGGHRPQETCTTQVFDQLVAAMNAVSTSPVTGAPMRWCALTGDNTDNRTRAETDWFLDVLAGREVVPNTGADGRYEGAQRSGWRGVWHPDDPDRDVYGKAGYPRLEGFLDAAVAPFRATGLDVGWVTVVGNHDVLYQGTFNTAMQRLGDLLAQTGTKPRGHVGLVRASVHTRMFGTGRRWWERLALGPGFHQVTPDPQRRRSVPIAEMVRRIADDGDHGLTAENVESGTTWWSRAEGDSIQVIGLDTCNHTTGSSGSIGPAQTAWLTEELARHHRRHLGADGEWVDVGGTDRLVVVLSHHNSWTMDNKVDDDFDAGPRTLGPDLVALLGRFPNVVLWANGHSHQHKIIRHRGPEAGGGFWEVDTSSGIDFSQQGRTYEILDNGDGTMSILVTVVDHLGPPLVPYRQDDGWSVPELASISRELAVNDDRWIEPMVLLGTPADRNVELVLKAPFPLR